MTSGVTLEVGRVQARRRKMAAVSGDSDSAWKLTLKSSLNIPAKPYPASDSGRGAGRHVGRGEGVLRHRVGLTRPAPGGSRSSLSLAPAVLSSLSAAGVPLLGDAGVGGVLCPATAAALQGPGALRR